MMTTPKRAAVWAKTDGHCYYCGMDLHEDDVKSLTSRSQSWMEIDHIAPIRDGGSDDMSNLTPECAPCNSSKSSKSVEAFRYACAKRESGRPHMTREILDWLESEGIKLPDLPDYKFWFECKEEAS